MGLKFISVGLCIFTILQITAGQDAESTTETTTAEISTTDNTPNDIEDPSVRMKMFGSYPQLKTKQVFTKIIPHTEHRIKEVITKYHPVTTYHQQRYESKPVIFKIPQVHTHTQVTTTTNSNFIESILKFFTKTDIISKLTSIFMNNNFVGELIQYFSQFLKISMQKISIIVYTLIEKGETFLDPTTIQYIKEFTSNIETKLYMFVDKFVNCLMQLSPVNNDNHISPSVDLDNIVTPVKSVLKEASGGFFKFVAIAEHTFKQLIPNLLCIILAPINIIKYIIRHMFNSIVVKPILAIRKLIYSIAVYGILDTIRFIKTVIYEIILVPWSNHYSDMFPSVANAWKYLQPNTVLIRNDCPTHKC